MAAALPASSIYVSLHLPQTWQEVEADCNNLKIPAYEKIGRIYARAIAILKEGNVEDQEPEFFQLLQLLGADATQQKSVQMALQLFRNLFQLQAHLPKLKEDTMGIYFLSKLDSSPEFVFKIGAKRASTELLAVKQADLMGLSDHIVRGLHCALTNPPADKDVELVEELWNGKDKFYYTQPPYSVGIIEPFLKDSPSEDPLLSYSKMLLVALGIGLRDGKLDGVRSHTLIDLDDCFTPSIDPPFFQNAEELKNTAVAATDLPLLKDPLASTLLNAHQIATLAAIVETWDNVAISQQLRKEPIRYADHIAEKNKAGEDETGASFSSEQGSKHLIRGDLKVDIAIKTTILNKAQQTAIVTRMKRVKEFILNKHKNNEVFTPIDIVSAVDPFSKSYVEELEKVGRDFLRGSSPREVVGRSPLSSLASSFDWPEDKVNILATSLHRSVSGSNESKEGEEDSVEDSGAEEAVTKLVLPGEATTEEGSESSESDSEKEEVDSDKEAAAAALSVPLDLSLYLNPAYF